MGTIIAEAFINGVTICGYIVLFVISICIVNHFYDKRKRRTLTAENRSPKRPKAER